MPIWFRALAALVMAAACSTTPPEPPSRPNVLLVSVDGLSAARAEQGTGLARMTAEGTVLETVVLPSVSRAASAVTLLTGMPPELHQVDRGDLRLADRAQTLPEVLAQHGYVTAWFGTGHGPAGLEQGFQGVGVDPSPGERADSWLSAWSEASPAAPFFLMVELDDPTRVESLLEELGAALERLEILDDTLVVVTSSHTDDARALSDEVIVVPLIARLPGRVVPGGRQERQVRLMDVAPTVLGLVRVAPPAGFGSGSTNPLRERDVSRWLTGDRPASTFPVLTAFSRDPTTGTAAVRTARYKLLVPSGSDAAPALYDLTRDPGESDAVDVVGPEGGRVRALAGSLRAWREHWATRESYAAPAP